MTKESLCAKDKFCRSRNGAGGFFIMQEIQNNFLHYKKPLERSYVCWIARRK